MGNGGLIISGPVDVFMDPNGGSDFSASNQFNFSGESVTIENQPELFQLAVDQRGTHIRQTLNKVAVVVKFKIEESTIRNLIQAFPFAQGRDDASGLVVEPPTVTIPDQEVWIGISDGSDTLKFFSMLLKGKNPKDKDLEVYIPRAVIRGTTTIEHKRDATQGIPVEIMVIAPNECDSDLLDGEGDFSTDPGGWTFTGATPPDIDSGVLRYNASADTAAAEQDLSAVLFPRSGGSAGAYNFRGKTAYRVVFEVSNFVAAGDLTPIIGGKSGAAVTIASASDEGIKEQDILIDVEPPADSDFVLSAAATADYDIDNVRVFPVRSASWKEF